MSEPVWPASLTRESRPWTRWWWLGSALDETEITRSLEAFHTAGIGGVEISPIYGVRGFEARFVPYLSPRWTNLLLHTLREARRLGMGVDMISGTGWPFGGPWVTEADAARQVRVQPYPLKEGTKGDPLAVSDASADGKRYALVIAPTGQQVKRAAPGGEGLVLDHFSAKAVRDYLTAFDTAFRRLPDGEMLRCIFNDSWEVFGANATPDILAEFRKRRGYDLSAHLAALGGSGDADMVARVRHDYRLTIHDLTRDAFIGTWSGWAHGWKAKARNQAHGSPGNLLDLYAAVDIPETEVFGPARLRLGGMEPIGDLTPDYDSEEELLVNRMASSAAHVAGKPLCSSESFTWLGEHGKVPLEWAKAEADMLFTLGINHIFFHGTPYSPHDVPWPGWLFYASTLMAPANTFWRDLPAFNHYLARCQSLLQQGMPDNDLLFYFPFEELIRGDEGATDLLQFLRVHDTGKWLRGNLPAFTDAARLLTRRGWSYDFVSDRQLTENVRLEGANLTATGGGRYRALLVAGSRFAPAETVERIAALARDGATVLVAGDLPTDVPGLSDLETARARLHAARSAILAAGETATVGMARRYPVGKGAVWIGADVEDLMQAARISRETLADHGIEFTRRRMQDGSLTYFLSNPGREDREAWVALPGSARSARLLNPMTEAIGAARVREGAGGGEALVRLRSGESVFLQTRTTESSDPAFSYAEPAGPAVPLTGEWEVTFIEGGPTLPPPMRVRELTSWTEGGDTDAAARRAFSGTARYRLTFDAPAAGKPASGWELGLGTVLHSARVRLNGEEQGTVYARPFGLPLRTALKPTGNVLEIEVTSLMANRLADLERREGDAWRPFLLVNIHYKPFDAAKWDPLPSGLQGPVTLTPLKA